MLHNVIMYRYLSLVTTYVGSDDVQNRIIVQATDDHNPIPTTVGSMYRLALQNGKESLAIDIY